MSSGPRGVESAKSPTRISVAIQLRISELLRQRGMTPYALAKASQGRISLSGAYRLMKANGFFSCIRASVLDAMCDILKVNAADLLTRVPSETRAA